jgi:uncharacterized protein (DUF2062 family)
MKLFPRLAVTAKPANTKASKSKRFWQNWKQHLRYLHWRLINLRGTSQHISRGLAAGVFAGLFPLFGLQIIIGVFLATLLRGNKLMAAAGTWVSNPLTYVPIWLFNFQVGRWLLGYKNLSFSADGIDNWREFLQLGTEFATALFVGCFVVGLVSAIVSYYLCLQLVRRIRRRSLNQPRSYKYKNLL